MTSSNNRSRSRPRHHTRHRPSNRSSRGETPLPNAPSPARRGTQRRRQRKWSFSAWLLSHRRAFLFALAQWRTAPLGAFFTVLALAIALALPSGALVLLQNARQLTAQWQGGSQISLYLQKESSSEEVDALISLLKEREGVEQVIYLSSEMALAEFGEGTGFHDALALLEENPLPPVLILHLVSFQNSPERLESLYQDLMEFEKVEQIDMDMEWMNRLALLIDAVQRTGWILTAMVLLGVVLIIGNTIRLDIANQQTEIMIIKRVGGTNAFIRRPFLYVGCCYGLGGGVLAWILMALAIRLIAAPLNQLADSFQSSFQFHGLTLLNGVALLFVALLSGLMGAWIAVTQHLRRIEPL
jgi:cell division transport system permease protein